MSRHPPAEYIALLKQVHAQELANRAQDKAARAIAEQTKSLNAQADAADMCARALDGFLQVLHGPAGFTASLYRNQTLGGLGAPDFGLSSPDFSGGGTNISAGDTIFNVTINAAPGQNGAQLYEEFLVEHKRRQRVTGRNPFAEV